MKNKSLIEFDSDNIFNSMNMFFLEDIPQKEMVFFAFKDTKDILTILLENDENNIVIK